MGRTPCHGDIFLRRMCTGENHQEAAVAVRRAIAGGDSRAVLPDAKSPSQRVLETSLLLAIRDSAPRISDPRPYRGHKVFRAVSPRPDALVVDLVDGVAERFFRALLPPVMPYEGGVGVPGLRVVPAKRHLALHLLDRGGHLTDARVLVRGIDQLSWRRIWAGIRDSFDNGYECVNVDLRRTPELRPGEIDGWSFQRRCCGPIALGSALLRRIGLLAEAFALDVWPGNGDTVINVEIRDGPAIRSVMRFLREPRFGVIRDSVVELDEELADDSYVRISETNPAPGRFTGDPSSLLEPPGLVLRRLGKVVAGRLDLLLSTADELPDGGR